MPTNTLPSWELRPATPDDVEAMAELRAVVMRPDLERLGVYDDHGVRQRLRNHYAPEHTRIVESEGTFAGCVTARPFEDGRRLENFYLSPALQGRGIGSAILRDLLAGTDAEGVPVRLQALRGSASLRLYERHGFVREREAPFDVFMVRKPTP
ncbi:GNAT family N-acetyltransferase [Streptomyces arboris]|uniref:GNAT family N-acetyltransferase n=1 Tax=Streptomyces arboris TaxID=2600619 RepID=UPI003BF5209E